jgi:FkbM family methyltransferase
MNKRHPHLCVFFGIFMNNRIFKALAICFVSLLSAVSAFTEAKLVGEDKKAGLELWETLIGRLWIPSPGIYVIKHLEREQVVQKVYDYPSAHVLSGDTVIDCGAHIGGFTRMALRAGARLVVAIEPEKANIVAFRRNFSEEIKNGRVILIEKGVWDKTGSLSLHLSNTGDSHSVAINQNAGKDQAIEVTTIDSLIENLKLSKVDFIKMDIEGAELNALRGSREVLKRWHPRLAISSYHKKGDPSAICALVWESQPNYLIGSKELLPESEKTGVPKVLFFY